MLRFGGYNSGPLNIGPEMGYWDTVLDSSDGQNSNEQRTEPVSLKTQQDVNTKEPDKARIACQACAKRKVGCDRKVRHTLIL